MNRKLTVLLVSLALVLCVGVGGTLAYLFDITQPVENTFTPSEVTTEVVETVENDVKKDVMIHNTGDTVAFIRAAIVVNWADGEGNVYGKTTPVKGTDYVMEFYNDADDGKDGKWIMDSSDGFYYWTKPVAANDNDSTTNVDLTGMLIKSVKLADNVTAPEGYALSVEILCSGVQSVPAEAVEAWSNGLYTVSDAGETTAQLVAKANS